MQQQILLLFKLELGINGTQKDDYYTMLLESAEKDLKSRAIHLDLSQIDDMMLLIDYTAWCYRNRNENNEIPKNLELRLLNRKMQRRVTQND